MLSVDHLAAQLRLPAGPGASRLHELLHPFGVLAARGAGLSAEVAWVEAGSDFRGRLPRFVLSGPPGGGDVLRVGIFAALHGDEPAGAWALADFAAYLLDHPELATGFELVLYPCCNPAGFLRGTRENGAGLDLNREFWRGSTQPEVRVLEHELRSRQFAGVIALHSDDTCEGVYGFTHGRVLTEELLRPALRAAHAFLPVDTRRVIDGFEANESMICTCYQGVMSPPPEQWPQPFDLIFETPALAPLAAQRDATSAALVAVLQNYRRLMAEAVGI